MKDYMKNYQPYWTGFLKAGGTGLFIGSVFNFLTFQEKYIQNAQLFAILGSGSIGIGFLGDLTAYTKAYFNERLNILKDQKPNKLEDKMGE